MLSKIITPPPNWVILKKFFLFLCYWNVICHPLFVGLPVCLRLLFSLPLSPIQGHPQPQVLPKKILKAKLGGLKVLRGLLKAGAEDAGGEK